MKIFVTSLALFFSSFFLSLLINKHLIKIERKKHDGQSVNKYLMENHQKKKQTPSLGGIGIIFGIIFSSIITYSSYKEETYQSGVFLLICFFLIGMMDDFIKIKFKNYKGLSSLIRILLETVVVLGIYYYLSSKIVFDNKFHLSKQIFIYLGSAYLIGFLFVIVGSANAVNLTDGLDGLAGGLYLIAIIPFIIFCFKKNQYALGYLLLQTYGATFGFLMLNLYPAKIFMGDSGSIALGGLLGYVSLILKSELLLVIIAGLFVLETISVMIQVTYFHFTKKRIFLMAPFHHHLELKGKYEYQIVMLFYVIGFTLSFIGLYVGLFL